MRDATRRRATVGSIASFDALACARRSRRNPPSMLMIWWDEVREQLLTMDGVLVLGRSHFGGGATGLCSTPCLREVASRGVWVSGLSGRESSKWGVKQVLYRTKHLGWGTDTHLYRTVPRILP